MKAHRPHSAYLILAVLSVFLLVGFTFGAAPFASADEPAARDAATPRGNVEDEISSLENALRGLLAAAGNGADGAVAIRDLCADADIFAKGARWALRYDTDGKPTDAALIQRAVVRGISRSVDMAQTQTPAWATKRGRVVRGYVSSV